MNLFQRIWYNVIGVPAEVNEPIKEELLQSKEDFVVDPQQKKPVSGGRESVPPFTTLLSGILDENLGSVNPDYPYELLKIMPHLATFNADVSYAVDNIVQLGNTTYTIYFDDGVQEAQKTAMLQEIADSGKKWYLGGMSSLINSLLAQAALFGTVSVEAVPTLNLDGIEKAVLVAPATIRFKYDVKQEKYKPYQEVYQTVNPNVNNSAGMVLLNELTYSYFPYRTWDEKPYGIPPFFAALDTIKIENDMICGLKNVIDKLGIFGFLSVLVKPPTRLNGESDLMYYEKLTSYLRNQIEPEVKKGFNKGYVIGFEGTHSFELKDTISNVQGVKDLFELISTIKHSGLKQDSIMFGRDYTTTETLGRVILAKMTNQIRNYQKLVSAFMEKTILLHLLLKGFKLKSITVEFDAPMISDNKKEEEAYGLKVDNAIKLYNQGIIGNDQVAQIAGYDEAEEDEPRQVIDPEMGVDAEDSKATEVNSADVESAIYELTLGTDEDNWSDDCCGHTHTDSFANNPMLSDLSRFVNKYFKNVRSGYGKAVNTLTNKIGKELLKIDKNVGEQAVIDTVLYHLYNDFGATFSKKQKYVIRTFVSKIYDFFRKDKRFFKGIDPKKIPDSVFSQTDLRTIEYYSKSDEFYLGKFITSSNVKKDITAYIKEQYIVNGLPIGGDKKALAKFKKEFGNVLMLEDWMIKNIINTTVNRLRNTAAVSYMSQAEVDEFMIVGVKDSLQCAYCAKLQGKKFKISKAMETVTEVSKSEPEFIGFASPFINSAFKKPEDLDNVSVEDLQSKGIGVPPFHVNCRDVITAVL